MHDITRILCAIEKGEPQAAEQLLPCVYDELRKLAAARLASEQPDQTLQPTALVHEAFLRLVDQEQVQKWDSRGHFFAAAAEAMRRIVVDGVRRKGRLKRGGDRVRNHLHEDIPDGSAKDEQLLAINEALTKLEAEDPQSAALVKLRFYVGMSITEAAEAIGISRTTAYEQWAYARAWLRNEIEK